MVFFALRNTGANPPPVTIWANGATTRPLLVNPTGPHSFMLVGVKQLFTSTGGRSRRETVLRLSVRLSTGKRSITGQIVVALQRRLALAPPSAQSATGNQCN